MKNERKTVHVITILKYLHNNNIGKTPRKSGKHISVTMHTHTVHNVRTIYLNYVIS